MNSKILPVFIILLCNVLCCWAIYEWSFQQRFAMPGGGNTYGKSESFIVGRGFQTLITGYDSNSPGLYVHTNDDGYVRNHQYVWSQTAKLVAKDIVPSDNFGYCVQAYHQTVLASAPFAGGRRGFVYVFNGTLRHWSQIQRLQAVEAVPGDFFGNAMSLHKDRLIVGAQGSTSNQGAVYLFERQGLYWSRQGKLLARNAQNGWLFGERLALYGTTAVISAQTDIGDGSTDREHNTGGAYIFQCKLFLCVFWCFFTNFLCSFFSQHLVDNGHNNKS